MLFNRAHRVLVHSAAGLALLAGAAAASGQCVMQKFTHADRLGDDQLGSALAMYDSASGVHLVAGAPGDDVSGLNSAGSVRFYYRNISNVWGEASWLTITASDAAADDRFGAAVAVSAPNIVVGAPGAGTWGKVYVYLQFGPQYLETILPYSGGVNGADAFGEAVAIDGDWLIAGAPDYDYVAPGQTYTDIGRTLFYKRNTSNNTWSQTAAHSVPGAATQFQSEASAVSIHGDRAASGAVYYNGQQGGVYLFDRNVNAWPARPIVTAADGAAGDQFGAAVALDGDFLIVGAPKDDLIAGVDPVGTTRLDAGSVYVYRFDGSNNLVLEAKLIASDPADDARFGSSLSLKDGLLVVGASNAEQAYAFRRVGPNKWSQVATVRDPDGPDSLAYGGAQMVATQGEFIAIGDKYDNDGGVIAGAAYIMQPTAAYGDTCDSAMPVQIGNHAGCTTFAGNEGATTCGNGGTGQGPDVWFSWTPSCSGNIILDTFGSGFDTVLSVHSDCPEAGNSHTITCNDDGFTSPNLASLVTLNYAAGTTYLIRISGFSGASGGFALRMVDSSTVPNDSCSSPATATSGNTYTFRNCKATTDANILVGCVGTPTVNDVWYRFSAPTNGLLSLNTNGSTFDTVLTVYADETCPTNLPAMVCNDDGGVGLTSALQIALTGGQQYMIRVGGFSTTSPTGDGVLNVGFVPACRCDWNLSGQLSVQDIFDFLAAYFSGSADFNASGATTVQDIFDFLACYFAGCP